MKQETNNGKFKYSYSAPTELERREIASIKKQYEAQGPVNSKLARLRRLDSFVRGSAMSFGISSGVIGLLIFGLGMAMVLEWALYIWGIVVAMIGVFPMVLAYPIYKYTLSKNKNKYGDEILRLSGELLGENEG